MISSRHRIGTLIASLFLFAACGAPAETSSLPPLAIEPEAPAIVAPAEILDPDGVTSLTIPSPNIARLWGSSASNIWGVGAGGLTLHWDGKVWRRLPNATGNNLQSMWGSSANDIWAVGNAGTVVQWNGTRWSKIVTPAPSSVDLTDVYGTSASDIWVVGESGTILHYDGTSWSDVSVPVLNSLLTVWASSTTNAWAGGELGYLVHWDGTSWSESASTSSETITSIRGASATKIWLASLGRLYLWNGTSWLPVSSGEAYGSTITVVNDHEIWASGSTSSTVFFNNGTAWKLSYLTTSSGTQSIWSAGGSSAWAFSFDYQILRYNGSGWSKTW